MNTTPTTSSAVHTVPERFVAGRAADIGQRCDMCAKPAVSTFDIGGRVVGHACEGHLIEVHDRAEKLLTPEIYVRGSATGRVNVSRVEIGERVLVEHTDLGLMPARRKTNAMIATVTGKRKGGWRLWVVTTDQGEFELYGPQTMWTVPA